MHGLGSLLVLCDESDFSLRSVSLLSRDEVAIMRVQGNTHKRLVKPGWYAKVPQGFFVFNRLPPELKRTVNTHAHRLHALFATASLLTIEGGAPTSDEGSSSTSISTLSFPLPVGVAFAPGIIFSPSPSSSVFANRFSRSETCVGCSFGQAPIASVFAPDVVPLLVPVEPGLLNVAEYFDALCEYGAGRFGGWAK